MEVAVTEARALSREELQENDQLAAECQGRSVAGVMTKIRMKYVYALFTLFLLVVEAKTQPGASDPKRTVDRFLNAWLVKKDFTQVRRDFSAEAFSNKLILSEDCIAYIRDKDRAFPERVEQQAMKFLRDFASATAGTSLKTILVFENWPDENKGQINSGPKDGYMLLQTENNDVINDEEWSYLKSKFSASEYLSLIVTLKMKDGQGTFYFHWAKFGRHWKIIHLGMQCV